MSDAQYTPEKRCCACKQFKSPSEFHKNKSKKDGLANVCKECDHIRALGRRDEYTAYDANHQEERRQASAKRRAENPEYFIEYRNSHKEEMSEYGAEYRAKTKDHQKTRHAKYYQENKERIAEVGAEYVRTHRDQVNAKTNRRRALRNSAEGTFTAQDILELQILQFNQCAYCGCDISEQYDIDHIVPLSRGGTNWPHNLALACGSCNRSKGNRLLNSEWIPLQP